MEGGNKLLLSCKIGQCKYAFSYKAIVMVTRVVKITSISADVEKRFLGVINVHGEIIPVINIRKLMHITDKERNLNEKLIVLHCRHRKLAIVVDSITGLIEPLEFDIESLNEIVPDQELFEGILKKPDEMIFIFNSENLLSKHDENDIKSILDVANIANK